MPKIDHLKEVNIEKLDGVTPLIKYPPPTNSATLYFNFLWHITPDTWPLTRDTWQLTPDTQGVVNIVSKFQVPSSYGSEGVLKIFFTKDEWLSELINQLNKKVLVEHMTHAS